MAAAWAATAVLVAADVAHAGGGRMGVAIDVGRIDIRESLLPGGSYRLPLIGVRNPGTALTHYVMTFNSIQGARARAPSVSWFQFEPREFSLAPGHSRAVRARIALPTNAQPADYEGLLEAQITSGGKGATVGAAAAARLTFTVKPSNFLQAAWLSFRTFLSDTSPWSYAIAAVLLLGLVLAALRRRFSLRIRLEKR